MLNFDCFRKGSGIVSLPDFLNEFSRKLVLIIDSINWPNFIFWMPLVLRYWAIWIFEIFVLQIVISYPVDRGRKLNLHETFRTSPKRLMYVQFTSCAYWVAFEITLTFLIMPFSYLAKKSQNFENLENVNWTYMRCSERLLNVLCTFNLRPVLTG